MIQRKGTIIFAFALMFLCKYELVSQQKRIVLPYRDRDTKTQQWLSIIPYDENIVRVVASPDTHFLQRSSLVVTMVPKPEVSWKKRETEESLVGETNALVVKVEKRTGAVCFYTKQNNLLLKEPPFAKTFLPTEVLGEQAFRAQQVFRVEPQEGFYGLGQHQNGIFNYHGHTIELWQYNIVAVVPFLVSSKNYGILWDNYSRTKFGDPREYQSLEVLPLYDRNNREGGITAEYFEDEHFQRLYTTRHEKRIYHKYIDMNDPFPDRFHEKVKAVRWSGTIHCKESGTYTFRLYCSGYTKLWLNGRLVVDSWRQNWLPWYHFPTLTMEKGKKYDIKLEWIHSGGYIGLEVLTPAEKFDKHTISFTSDVADGIDYYFIAGNSLDEVIASYRALTGQAPMMPKWALGLWQCRERYKTQEELLDVVREFRKRGIPLDNIVQDWFYWEEDKWGDHEFDRTRYPNPAQMVQTLHDSLHTRIMISVWPKFYVGTKNYEEMKSHGYLYMRNIEKEQRDWVGPGYVSTFYDPYSEGARALFWKQIKDKLFTLGIDAWWLDCTEPDIHSNLSREETILRQHPTALGSGARYLNTYSLMNSKAVYEGQREADPNRRVFILTRSAFAGQQRYSAVTWSGDVAARWHDLKMQVPAGLNFCLSGIPYWTTDIGGFAVEPRFENPDTTNLEEWRELQTRWFQFGTFCPIFRVHGQYPYREIFHIAPPEHPAYQAMLSYNKLRYRLLPYIYSLAGMVTHNGYTIMRALVMDFGNDTRTYSIGDQFMFGPSILVNPVTEYKQRSRDVYLPKGCGWYHLSTGKYYNGGRTIHADAPYTAIPLFVREGSIIPCGPEIQWTDEKQAEPLRLFIYTGRNAEFSLYEDEGTNNNYEKGLFSWIPLQYSEKERTLTIGKRRGSYPGMLTERTFEIVWISKEKQCGLDFTTPPDTVVRYTGEELRIRIK